MRVRLQDVARHAGVSLAAASMALRGASRISQTTTARVQASAQILGYHPDTAAQALARSINRAGQGAFYGTIALLFGDAEITSPAWLGEDGKGNSTGTLPQAAAGLGYTLDVFPLPTTPSQAASISRQLRARNIRGLVIKAGNRPIPDTGFPWEHFATIVMSPQPGDMPFHRISSLSINETYTAVNYCHQHNCRKLGLIVDDSRFADWRGGFEAATARLGLQKAAKILPMENWDEPAFLRWFKRHRPDAIIANQDDLPISALARQGLACPGDFSYCCLDIPPGNRHLTGFRQLRSMRDQLAVELLHGFLRRQEYGFPAAPLSVQVAHQWVEGTTLRKMTTSAVTAPK